MGERSRSIGCCFPNCSNKYRKKGTPYFGLPMDKSRLTLWLKVIRQAHNDNTFTISSTATVCGQHFPKESVFTGLGRSRSRLAPDAIPSLDDEANFKYGENTPGVSLEGQSQEADSEDLKIEIDEGEEEFEPIEDPLCISPEDFQMETEDVPRMSPAMTLVEDVSQMPKIKIYPKRRISRSNVIIHRCLLCGRKSSLASVAKSGDDDSIVSEWTENMGVSLCEVLNIDAMTFGSLFARGAYCLTCFQLLLNIDYTLKKRQDLENILEREKEKALRRIATYYGPLATLGSGRDPYSRNFMTRVVNQLKANDPDHFTVLMKSTTDEHSDSPSSDEEANLTSTDNKIKPSLNSSTDVSNPKQVNEIASAGENCETFITSLSNGTSSARNKGKTNTRRSKSWPVGKTSRKILETKDNDYNDKNVGVQESSGTQLDLTQYVHDLGSKLPMSRRAVITCSRCPEAVFENMKSLQKHSNRFHAATSPHPHSQHKCAVGGCGVKFNRFSELCLHHAAKHPDVQPPFLCSDCGKPCFTECQLKKHQHTAHGEMTFNCDKCDMKFRHKCNLLSHQETHSKEYNYLCPDCGRMMKTQKQFSHHKIELCPKRTEELKPTVIRRCERRMLYFMANSKTGVKMGKFCRSTFPLESTEELTLHESLHTAGAPGIQCVITPCPTQSPFRNVHSLQDHVREVHYLRPRRRQQRTAMARSGNSKSPDSGTKNFCNDECGLSFDTQHELTQHRIEMNPKLQIKRRTKAFSCDVCKRAYTTRYQLDEHQYISHTKNAVARYQCKTCGRLFMRKQLCQVHERIHDGAVIPCSKCGKSFGTEKNLRRHQDYYCRNRERDLDGNYLKKEKIYPRKRIK